MAAHSRSCRLTSQASHLVKCRSSSSRVENPVSATAVNRSTHSSSLRTGKVHQRRNAGTATVPRLQQAVAGSNLPPNVQDAIKHDVSLPNPDPPSDSQTAHLVSSTAPYILPTYVRPPPMMAKGDGCYIYDIENRVYLDFMAGISVNALGHGDPELVRIISSQASTLMHTSNLYHNPWTGLLSERLVQRTREMGGMRDAAKVFVCNSGTEANEAAIKFARKWGTTKDPTGRKNKILSFHGSFHGRTMGALSATANPNYQKPFAPMVPGFEYATLNDIEEAQSLISDEFCGVLVEPIQGEGGVNVATPEFLRALREKCDEHDAVLMFDEIQCGMGRTGNFWAHSGDTTADAPHPDVLTTAKALGNGYPVGATILTDRVADVIVKGDHGTTFGGNPLASRIAHYLVGRLSDASLLESVTRKEQIFRRGLNEMSRKFPGRIREVRGRGLLLGVQLEPWKDNEKHEGEPATAIVSAARERGLLVVTCGSNTLRLVPPLVIEDEQIEQGLNVLDQAMVAVFGEEDYKVAGTQGQQEIGPPR